MDRVPGKMLDMGNLVVTGGQERTEAEYHAPSRQGRLPSDWCGADKFRSQRSWKPCWLEEQDDLEVGLLQQAHIPRYGFRYSATLAVNAQAHQGVRNAQPIACR